MFEKLSGFWSLFKAGQEVANAEKWKSHQITATMLAAVFMALVNVLKGYGYDLPITNEVAMEIAGGFIAVVNVILTTITSKRVGFATKSADDVQPEPEEQLAANVMPVVQQTPTAEVVQSYKGVLQHFDAAKVEEAKRYMERDFSHTTGG